MTTIYVNSNEIEVDEDFQAVSEAYVVADSGEALIHLHTDGDPISVVAGAVLAIRAS